MKRLLLPLLAFFALPAGDNAAPPPLRVHRIIQKIQDKQKVEANIYLQIPSEISIKIQKSYRLIEANGIPRHKTGQFPNSGNPYKIKVQKYKFRIPTNQKGS